VPIPEEASFDQLVGAGENRWRDRQTERLCSLDVDSFQREIVDRAVLSLKDAGVPSFLIE